MDFAALLPLLHQHAKPTGKAYAYGTAGFRGPVDEGSPSVFVRVGAVAWVRAVATGRAVGLCVTASHNPERDNGVKLVDPDGGMLAESWEEAATRVVNAHTPEECVRELTALAASNPAPKQASTSSSPLVYTARDTRSHSERLEQLAVRAASLLAGKDAAKLVVSLGVLTTPQLHFVVMRHNGFGYGGAPTEAGYYAELADAFATLVKQAPPRSSALAVDCANGVGALKAPHLLAAVNDKVGPERALRVEWFNTATTDFAKLNEGCGAEHVQKSIALPVGAAELSDGSRVASFDGDADRIVFFSVVAREPPALTLLDGDKIACLLAKFLKSRLDVLGLFPTDEPPVGCVQTAYANGASTKYLTQTLRVAAPLVKTGVKHLHHRAAEFPVGVYFEANGHGTVLFSRELVDKVTAAQPATPEGVRAKEAVLAMARLLNQATGDAMSDLLAVEAALRLEEMDFPAWAATYTDLPSKQSKVKVPDRTAVKTSADETRCVAPAELQRRIDEAVAKRADGRAFARPSGTEDVVRVYAEARSPADAAALAADVEAAIKQVLGQGGDRVAGDASPAKKAKEGPA